MIGKISTLRVKDYIKTIITDCSKFYIGNMDENQEQAIAIYANKRDLPKISNSPALQTYSILPITLLLRWTKNYNTAETMANKIYGLLHCSSFLIDDYKCNINCLYEGPIDLGPDSNGVYKFSIELNLLYRKGD